VLVVRIMELLYAFFPVPSYFLLGPKIFLSTLFSNTLGLCSSFNVRHQVSHPHKTWGKIIFLSILKFSERRREYKRFWTEWQQTFPEFNVLLISSEIHFLSLLDFEGFISCHIITVLPCTLVTRLKHTSLPACNRTWRGNVYHSKHIISINFV
jgi:hypothetical protein